MEQGWTKIRVYERAIKAEMDKQLLEENNIPVIILNKQDSSLKFGRIELYVNQGQVEEASDILATVYNKEEEE
ncbi:MAG TPA: DUF2007 domain-containing protein [Sphingobacterium sp.]|nr:DUF2007 domain-containing protein [Sphingobacterium sp.]